MSAFHILGVETKELTHAALFAWLIDPRAQGQSQALIDAVDVDQFDLTDSLAETERWIDVPGKKASSLLT